MIKINILDDFGGGASEDLLQIEETEGLRKNLLIRMVIITLGPAALFGYEQYNISQLTGLIPGKEAELKGFQDFNKKKESIRSEIEKWSKDQKRLDKQIDFLRFIEEDRHISRDIILQIQKIMPDQVWLKSIVTEEKTVTIEGEGIDQADILELNKRLETLSFLKEVTLPSVNPISASTSGLTTYGFEFKAEINRKRDAKE